MQLPRRVPWTSPVELDQVCAWTYTEEHDLDTKVLAINRLSAWKAMSSLPHALESALALLVVTQQDRGVSGFPSNHLVLRHSYAAAIIRLVNGFVDPLQLGAYARSIASIAAQLGLPIWLVELRHAATHEDLPCLEILREAARQSMGWLLHNYFLPTINPTSASDRDVPLLRPLTAVLKQYKSMMKAVTRDASLRTRYKQEVNAIMRGVERWIAEAKVAANGVIGDVDWESGVGMLREPQGRGGNNSIDSKEKLALEQFCDALLETGVLVPLSKKKRTPPEDRFWPPPLSVSLWTPLLNHIQVLHTHFPHILCTRILSILIPEFAAPMPPYDHFVSEDEAATGVKHDPSYHMCLARWVMWSLDTWSNPTVHLRRDVTRCLLQALGHGMSDLRSKDNIAAKTLLQAICSQNPACITAVDLLIKSSNQLVPKEWADHDMVIMTNRLTQFLSTMTKKTSLPSVPESGIRPTRISACDSNSEMGKDEDDSLPNGWRRANNVSWKPCPVGVFYHVQSKVYSTPLF